MKKGRVVLGALALGVVFPVISCSNNSVNWDFSIEKLEKSVVVSPGILTSEGDLVIKLEGDGLVFNPKKISKDTLIVHSDDALNLQDAYCRASTNDEKEIITSKDQLMIGAINDFSYRVSTNNDALYITIPEKYKDSNMDVVLHPSCSSLDEYVCTAPFTGKESDVVVDPYLKLVNDTFNAGETSPKFTFNYANLGEINPYYISFDGALAPLFVVNAFYSDNTFVIDTTGMIMNEENGYVVIEKGFSSRIEETLSIPVNIINSTAYADPLSLSFTFNPGATEATFDVNFTSDIEEIKTSDVEIENPGSISLKEVTCHKEYNQIVIKVMSSATEEDVFLNDLRKAKFYIYKDYDYVEVNLEYEEPTIYTDLISVDEHTLKAEVSIYNGSFDSLHQLTKNDITIENGSEVIEEEKISFDDIKKIELKDNIYEITFEFPEGKQVRYTRGVITYNNISFKSTISGASYTENVPNHFYYNEIEAEKYSGANLYAFNNTSSQPLPVEEVYEKVIKDKFPWQLGVKLANLVFTAGASFASCEGTGQAAATAIGLLLGVADAIGDISMDPIASIIMQLQVIDGKLDIISGQIAKLARDMEMSTSEMYHGIKKNTFLLYRSSWDVMNREIAKFDTMKRNYRGALTFSLVDWIKQGGIQHINLSFSTATEGGVTKNFNQVFPMYSGNMSTDQTTINSSLQVAINIDEVLKATKAQSKTSYDKRFTDTFVKEVVAYLENKGFDENLELVGEDEVIENFTTELFGSKTGAELKKAREHFAKDLLYSLMDRGNKTYFTNDAQGVGNARNAINEAITFFNQLSGYSSGGGTTPKFMDFYNMLYNKYSFQSEAITPLQTFRTKMKKIMYDYAAFAHNGLTLFPAELGGMKDELMESYKRCEDIFTRETGLRDTNAKLEEHKDLFTCDFCYVTGTFVTANVVKNEMRVTGKDKDKSSYGVKSTSWVTVKKPGSDTVDWRQINLMALPFIDETKIRWTFERCTLNGFITDNMPIVNYLINKTKLISPAVAAAFGGDKTNPALLTSYEGLTKVSNNITYNPTPSVTNGTIKAKICGKSYCPKWFSIGQKVDTLFIRNRDKGYYHIWRGAANVVAFNNPSVKLRDNIGHAWWLVESHWYWVFTADEIWGVEEFGGPSYYYVMTRVN